MTKILPVIDTSTDTWGDTIARINSLVLFASNNAITTGADSNDGDVVLNGDFTANTSNFTSTNTNSLTANTSNVTTSNTNSLTANTGSANTFTIETLTAQTANIVNLTVSNLVNLATEDFSSNTGNINYITSNETINANNLIALHTTTNTANVVNMTITGVQNANTINATQITTPTLTFNDGNNALTISKTTFDDIDDQINHKLHQTVGTWTPMIAIGANTSNITYSTRNGNYIKIGNMIHVSFNFTLSSKATQTGAITLTNLPANTAASYIQTGGVLSFSNTTSIIGNVFMNTSSGNVSVWNINQASGILNDTNLTDTSSFSGSITYITA